MNAFALGARAGLEKIAAAAHDDRPSRLGLSAASAASEVAVGGLGSLALVKTIKPSDVHLGDAMIARLKRNMGVSAPHEIGKGVGDAKVVYDVVTGQGIKITAPRNEFMAHELGHLVNLKNKTLRRGIVAGRALGPLAGIGTGIAMLGAGDRGDWKTRLAPAVAGLGFVPLLADEAAASVHGYKALQGLGTVSKPALRKARNNMIKAFGTYGVTAAAALAPLAYVSARRWRRE